MHITVATVSQLLVCSLLSHSQVDTKFSFISYDHRPSDPHCVLHIHSNPWITDLPQALYDPECHQQPGTRTRSYRGQQRCYRCHQHKPAIYAFTAKPANRPNVNYVHYLILEGLRNENVKLGAMIYTISV